MRGLHGGAVRARGDHGASDMVRVRQTADGCVVPVLVTAGSARNALQGQHDGRVKVCVTAPAEKGKANAAAREILAGALGIDGQYVQLIGGAASPRKKFRVAGLTAARIARKLAELS